MKWLTWCSVAAGVDGSSERVRQTGAVCWAGGSAWAVRAVLTAGQACTCRTVWACEWAYMCVGGGAAVREGSGADCEGEGAALGLCGTLAEADLTCYP